MKFRVPLFLLITALPLALLAQEAATPAPTATPAPKKSKGDATPTPTPKPTILKRWMKTFGLSQDHLPNTTITGFKGLDIGVQADPAQVRVGEVKQIKVTVTLANRGRKQVQLEFPTSQRIEVLVKNKDGKQIEQWSEDQSFSNEPSMVAINSEERLEYAVNIATRDMAVGQTYTIEAFFPNFDQLRKSITVQAVEATPATTPVPGKPGSSPAPGAAATPAVKHKRL